MASETVLASVVILTYNGEDYLGDILNALSVQKLAQPFEVIVIDSGSTDRTLEIVAQHPGVRLHTIPNAEFGHGRTRNLGAELARGKYVVYLTHDAIPATELWLYEMLAPFEINDRVVGVMGKQVPRPQCFPLLKYEIQQVFAGFGPDFGTSLFYKDDFVAGQALYDAISFYSDVNSAARRDYLVGKIPYREVDYAEDQLFGRDIIDAGLVKAYAGRGVVVHSNDLTLRQYRKRIFDETVGLRRVGFDVGSPSGRHLIRLMVGGVLRDSRRILRDADYSRRRKVWWLVINPLFHQAKWASVRHAVSTDLTDVELISQHSLEGERRSSAHTSTGDA